MLHHISLGVTDIAKSAAFYDAALLPLGYRRVFSDLRAGEQGQAVGYGSEEGKDKLALKQRSEGAVATGIGFHLAFSAPSAEAVAAFYKSALRAGGQANGAPGLRPKYGPNYFAAFVIDPDGHHLEAVVKNVNP